MATKKDDDERREERTFVGVLRGVRIRGHDGILWSVERDRTRTRGREDKEKSRDLKRRWGRRKKEICLPRKYFLFSSASSPIFVAL